PVWRTILDAVRGEFDDKGPEIAFLLLHNSVQHDRIVRRGMIAVVKHKGVPGKIRACRRLDLDGFPGVHTGVLIMDLAHENPTARVKKGEPARVLGLTARSAGKKEQQDIPCRDK